MLDRLHNVLQHEYEAESRGYDAYVASGHFATDLHGFRQLFRWWRYDNVRALRRRGPCPVPGARWAIDTDRSVAESRAYARGMFRAYRERLAGAQ